MKYKKTIILTSILILSLVVAAAMSALYYNMYYNTSLERCRDKQNKEASLLQDSAKVFTKKGNQIKKYIPIITSELQFYEKYSSSFPAKIELEPISSTGCPIAEKGK